MTTPKPRKFRRGGMAGGSLLALSVVAGIVIGTVYRQPSIGFVAGFAIGLALLLLDFLLDRRG